MKLIRTDNFCRETESDVLIKENISYEDGKKFVEDNNSTRSPYYYKVVPDDYKLYILEP